MSLPDDVRWTTRLELYFKSTAERSNGLSILHKRCEAMYSNRRNFIDLPVIVMSSLTGFMSVGSSSLFPDQLWVNTALGVVSLGISVLNTVGTYFGWARRTEAHRISSIHYNKLFRFLSMELTLPRSQRSSPTELLKFTKETMDRLQEVSPLIAPEVLDVCRKEFKKYEGTGIALPQDLNGLEAVVVHPARLEDIEVSETPVTIMNPLHSVDRNA